MSSRRRKTTGPLPVDIPVHSTVSPRVSIAFSDQIVDKSGEKREMADFTNYQAALEANPEVARKLARNKMLRLVIPALIAIIFIVIVLLI